MKRVYLLVMLAVMLLPIEGYCEIRGISQTSENLDSIVDWVQKNSIGISKNTAREIVETAHKESKYPLLLLALFKTESRFNCRAVSKRDGARGLGQVMPFHLKELRKKGILYTISDFHTIRRGTAASVYYLDSNVKKFGIDGALKRYKGSRNKRYISRIKSDMRTLMSLS